MRKLSVLFVLLLAASTLIGAQEIRRPTTDYDDQANGCGGTPVDTWDSSSAIPNAYDAGGEATSSSDLVFASDVGLTTASARGFSSFPVAGSVYSGLNLVVKSSCTHTNPDGVGACVVQYSINSGATWTTVNSGTWTVTTTTTALLPSQSLSTLRVRACYWGNPISNSTRANWTVFDIRTEGISSGAVGRKRSQTSGDI